MKTNKLRFTYRFCALTMMLVLSACQQSPKTDLPVTESMTARLSSILDAQDEETKARFNSRKPLETLSFFGVKEGMTVLEVLPGGGWYTKILLPYLGENGHLIAADYSMDMWPNFDFAKPEFIEKRQSWPQTWLAKAEEWNIPNTAKVNAYTLSSLPTTLNESVDMALYIRALHNLNRFSQNSDEKDFLGEALSETFRVLKPGGILAVVQHEARENMPNTWADGSNGYLKRSSLISVMNKHGFELADESSINANSLDKPTEKDFVWRLPPSLSTSKKDPELMAKYKAIGESNRMTLKFVKTIN